MHVTDDLGAVVPAQFYEARRTEHPEHDAAYRLLVAVLEDAIRLYQGRGWIGGTYVSPDEVKSAGEHRRRRARLFGEAEGWLFDTDSNGAMSSNWVCDALGIDAGFLRAGLRGWKGNLARRSRLGKTMVIRPTVNRQRRRSARV